MLSNCFLATGLAVVLSELDAPDPTSRKLKILLFLPYALGRLNEEGSGDLTRQLQTAKTARAHTSVQDTPPS